MSGSKSWCMILVAVMERRSGRKETAKADHKKGGNQDTAVLLKIATKVFHKYGDNHFGMQIRGEDEMVN